MKTIELGSKVKDIVSGFEGIATARIEYMNGCVQYYITPKVSKDGELKDGRWFDVQQVEVCSDGIREKIAKMVTGGPAPGFSAPTSYRG